MIFNYISGLGAVEPADPAFAMYAVPAVLAAVTFLLKKRINK